MSTAQHLEKISKKLPSYYAEFLEKRPLQDCREDIRERLACDLQTLLDLNNFFRNDITDDADEELGSLLVIGQDEETGETLAIDLSKPESSELYRLEPDDDAVREIPFNPMGKTFQQYVQELLDEERNLREERVHRSLMEKLFGRGKWQEKLLPMLFLGGAFLYALNGVFPNHERYGGLILALTVFMAIAIWCGSRAGGNLSDAIKSVQRARAKGRKVKRGDVAVSLVMACVFLALFILCACLIGGVVVEFLQGR